MSGTKQNQVWPCRPVIWYAGWPGQAPVKHGRTVLGSSKHVHLDACAAFPVRSSLSFYSSSRNCLRDNAAILIKPFSFFTSPNSNNIYIYIRLRDVPLFISFSLRWPQPGRCLHCHSKARSWANVCSPEHTSDTSTNYMIRFLIEHLVRRIWFGQSKLDFILNWLVMRCKLRPELAADAQQTAWSKM